MIPAGLLLSAIQAAAPAEGVVRSAADERFKLWGAYSFADPWFLLLIPAGFLALAWGRGGRGRERGRVPALVARAPRRSLAQRLAWLPTALSAADVGLYEAKRAGRDRVVVSQVWSPSLAPQQQTRETLVNR